MASPSRASTSLTVVSAHPLQEAVEATLKGRRSSLVGIWRLHMQSRQAALQEACRGIREAGLSGASADAPWHPPDRLPRPAPSRADIWSGAHYCKKGAGIERDHEPAAACRARDRGIRRKTHSFLLGPALVVRCRRTRHSALEPAVPRGAWSVYGARLR